MMKRRKIVTQPFYGKAPEWVICLSQRQLEQIYACFDAGNPLSSLSIVRQKRRTEPLLRRIVEENNRYADRAG